MSEPVRLLLALVAGFGLGLFYYGGLWLTLKKLPKSSHPVLLHMGSFFGRTVVILAGFYLVMGDRWERIIVCLAGALVARVILVRRLGRDTTAPELQAK